MWYKVDFNKLALLNSPTFLRKPRLYAYVKALMAPIVTLYDIWNANRTENLKKLSYNSQRCYLRKALNDKYDDELRRITIDDTLSIEQDYIYTDAENLDVYLGTMYLEQDFNYVTGIVDFIVNVPQDVLQLKENQIIATLNFYKLAGKSYKILEI